MGNPKNINEKILTRDLEKGLIPEKLFSIPYSYIKSIENQNGKNLIKIYYGNDSEEELIIKDQETKSEVFDFLKQDLAKFAYSEETPSLLRHSKPQILATAISLILFVWTFYLANQIENGVVYEVVGGGNPGIT